MEIFDIKIIAKHKSTFDYIEEWLDLEGFEEPYRIHGYYMYITDLDSYLFTALKLFLDDSNLLNDVTIKVVR